MNRTEKNTVNCSEAKSKLQYQAPMVVPLSDAATAYGPTSCHTNGTSASNCQDVGMSASNNCNFGNSAGQRCDTGSVATQNCTTGTSGAP
jgi:hypothetical protein